MPDCSVVLKEATVLREQRGILQHHGAPWHPSTPRSSVASLGCHAAPLYWRMQRCSVVLKDAMLLRGVEGCHAAAWFWRMRRCPMGLTDATLPHGVGGCHAAHHGAAWLPSTPRSSVASFDTTEQRGILHHHGVPWHPSPPQSSLSSINPTKHRGILQNPRCSEVLDTTLLHGIEGCHNAPWS
jgi:hypothetical protein